MPLSRFREKWREAPGGSDTDERVFSTDLLGLPDEALLAAWEAMAARRYDGELGWVGWLYRDTFRDGRVLELGSGLGFDGLRFAAWGAHWTFADIVPDNLALIERIATLKGLRPRTSFHLIPDDLSFRDVPGSLDAIWVFGSIHHVPFEMARREALNALPLLRAGGRWLELVYPRERWLREGALPFDEWGKLTDGERTPWAEWHDLEKVRRRLAPARLQAVLDFPFCSSNYRWLDLRYEGQGSPPTRPAIDLLQQPATYPPRVRPSRRDGTVTCLHDLFAEAVRIPLLPADDECVVDIEVAIGAGTIGVYLVDETGAALPGADAILDAGPDTRLATLRSRGARFVMVRNLRHRVRSHFRFVSLRQR